jgi:hypothetical protein
MVRAVQSSPFPPCACADPDPPGAAAAVGQGVAGWGWGPRGSLPDPAHLGPICEKSRYQDVKPTLLPNPRPQSCEPPGESGAPGALQSPEEPPPRVTAYRRSWVLQFEVADWVSFGLASSSGGLRKDQVADESPT